MNEKAVYIRSKGSRFMESLALVAVADIAAGLIKFIALLLTLPISGELRARRSPLVDVFDTVIAVICVVAFFLVLALACVKNPNKKSFWLNASYGTGYGLVNDLFSTAKTRFGFDMLAALLVGIPQYAVLMIFGDIDYIPLFFAPFYSMWQLVGNPIVSFALMGVISPVAILVFSLLAHKKWDSERLRK